MDITSPSHNIPLHYALKLLRWRPTPDAFTTSLCFLLLAGLLLGWSIAATRRRDRSFQPAGMHDFGVVAPEARLRHAFLVQNQSSLSVTIDRVVASCSSCSAAKVICGTGSCDTLNPGEKAAIVVDLDLREAAGAIRREFYLLWRRPDLHGLQRSVFVALARVDQHAAVSSAFNDSPRLSLVER